jgi:RNAse (barnase) inhibitor barstar
MIRFLDTIHEDIFHAYIAQIADSVSSKIELMEELSRELRFPDYFGNNWDALFDMLVDLHWIAQDRVIVFHVGLDLLPLGEFCNYMRLLDDASRLCDSKPGKALELILPTKLEPLFQAVISCRK